MAWAPPFRLRDEDRIDRARGDDDQSGPGRIGPDLLSQQTNTDVRGILPRGRCFVDARPIVGRSCVFSYGTSREGWVIILRLGRSWPTGT